MSLPRRALPLPLAYYYILERDVFQAPPLHMLLQTRLRRCLHSIRSGLGRMQAWAHPLCHGRHSSDAPTHMQSLLRGSMSAFQRHLLTASAVRRQLECGGFCRLSNMLLVRGMCCDATGSVTQHHVSCCVTHLHA